MHVPVVVPIHVVLLWHHFDTLCASSFVDYVMLYVMEGQWRRAATAAQQRHCSVVRRLTPLLRDTDCVTS